MHMCRQANMGFDDIVIADSHHNVSSTRNQHLVDSEEVMLLPVVGDALALAGAAAYSLYIFRIGELVAKDLPGDLLQAWKSAVLTVMFGLWGAYDYARWAVNDFSDETHPWAGWQHVMSWLLLFISAIFPGFCADLAQTKGQEVISAAESQILLASEPLFAALFGFLLLDEQLGAAEYLGGAFVIGGGLVVSGIFGCCEEPEQPDSASALLVGGLASQSNRMPSVDLIQFVNQKGAMFEDEVSPGKIAFPNPLDETNEKE